MSASSEGFPHKAWPWDQSFGTTCAVDIHCYFSPYRHFHSMFNWMGPDIFSPLTSVTGIFHYLSVVLELETIEWLEIHFVAVRVETGEPVTTVPFFLPRIEYSSCRLENIRWQMYYTIQQCYCRAREVNDILFQLVIWPWKDSVPDLGFNHKSPQSSQTPAISLQPNRFIKNICGAF